MTEGPWAISTVGLTIVVILDDVNYIGILEYYLKEVRIDVFRSDIVKVMAVGSSLVRSLHLQLPSPTQPSDHQLPKVEH